jgi:predicted exporter
VCAFLTAVGFGLLQYRLLGEHGRLLWLSGPLLMLGVGMIYPLYLFASNRARRREEQLDVPGIIPR